MPVPTPAIGKKKSPVPARMTVLPLRAAGDQETPKRGPTFRAGVWKMPRFPDAGKSSSPLTANWEAGSSGRGLLAYAARAAAPIGLGELKSKPLTDRL